MTNAADWLIYNARIWTGEEATWAQALAVSGERIVAVGTDEEIKNLADASTNCVDAGGKLVLPGFIDNHTHFLIGGFQLLSLDLRTVTCKEEFIEAVRRRAAELPDGAVLGGGGWSNDQWTQTDLPHRSWVDSFTLGRPVFLHRSDLHIAFANSVALRLAGIDRNTPDPVGGQILRDGNTGEPTGILKDNAVKLLQEKLPAPSPEEYDQALQAAMDCALRSGVTSVQDVTAWRDWLDWECMLRFQKSRPCLCAFMRVRRFMNGKNSRSCAKTALLMMLGCAWAVSKDLWTALLVLVRRICANLMTTRRKLAVC